MRQFTTRTGDWVFVGMLVGGAIGGIVVKEALDWAWVIGAAFLAGWAINEAHRRHDLREAAKAMREYEERLGSKND